MQNNEILRFQLNSHINQARQDIYTLSTYNCGSMTPQILQRLWDTLSSIQFISELLANQLIHTNPSAQQIVPINSNAVSSTQIPPKTPLSNETAPPPNLRNFTAEELSSYNGKNGRPAYVAVKNNVYDVTNNRAWAAATHFGLISGRDYTQEFASCHAGQQSILNTLPVVGRLV
ncbi:cytochrome b5 domain-containing protein [Rummeliibacillus pycnus]|uniref:cytochrome b5 domain-containing protein n=1 Tax=Rummeliibacillus pycnus TaxID=101070 RepID=UPI000C9A0071|nr:cytochrome b5 domain-containing protein [Rummeliibacillus pycnus]